MALVGQNQQTSFANPQNGQSPIDADVVRGNDNALVAKHNAHDSDATIHVQTGTLAARPAPSIAGALYLDENGRLYRDSGVAWAELPYARLDASGTNAFTNNVSIGGTLAVAGLLDVWDIDADDVLASTVTAGTLAGDGTNVTNVTVPASRVTSGSFPSGNYTFPGNITASSGALAVGSVSASGALSGASLAVTGAVTAASVAANAGQLRGTRVTQSGAGGSVSFASGNHVRHTMTGNGTLSLSGGVEGGIYTVEVLQDGTGGRTVAWSGVVWPASVTPTSTTTANRKDIFTFFFDGTNYLGQTFGLNYASAV